MVAEAVNANYSQDSKTLAPTPPQAQSPQAQSPNGTTEAKPAGDEEKSLDDLLGIGESDSKKASAESGRTQKETLQRILSEKEAKNTLEETVEGMRRSATLLSEKDSGTAVQRVQEDVLARLDALIASAQQQQQQQSSSSSSSSSSSGEKSKGAQQPKGGKGQKQSESAASEEKRREEAKQRASQKEGEKSGPSKSQPTGDRAEESPPSVDPIEGGVIQETDEEWGSLPPRTREIIRQGVREKMSSVYRRWTEAYYRRIAEESKP